MEMSLQIRDGAIALMPECLVVARRIHERFAAQQFGVYTDDQHFLVIGAVEDANPSARRQIARGTPQKIVFQLRWDV